MRPVARYRLFFSLSNLFFSALYTVQCDFKTLNWILVASGIIMVQNQFCPKIARNIGHSKSASIMTIHVDLCQHFDGLSKHIPSAFC